ncbi:MAG: IclR family transcriptional regulator [Desulfarculaceae bacterium]|jgi:IclR family pca regulon transcriptional regulator
MARTAKRPYSLSSLSKGLSILNTFSKERPQLTLTELAQANNMSLATATRYVVTLEELGYLTQKPMTKRYGLTPKILDIGFNLIGSMDLRSRAMPEMVKATEELKITTACAILEGKDILYIERFRSSDVVNLDLSTGSRLPAYCTSLGRAILSHTDRKEVRQILQESNLVKHTPYTKIDPKVILKELDEAREKGYALNVEELALGLVGMAVPIFRHGQVEAAFGFSFPYDRISDKTTKAAFLGRLKAIQKKVSFPSVP